MKKVEQIAKTLAESFGRDMQNPEYRGKCFDENTFNIERWVTSMLCLYLTKVTDKIKQEAAKTARKSWNEFWHICSPDMPYDEPRKARK